MDDSTKAVLSVIYAGDAYENNTTSITALVADKYTAIATAAATIVSAIYLSEGLVVDDDGVVEGGLALTDDAQLQVDSLEAASSYSETVSTGCSTASTYIDGVIDDYYETVSLHSLGAEIIDEMEGGGTDKFSDAYALTISDGLTTITEAYNYLCTIADCIPSEYDADLIAEQITLLDEVLDEQIDYSTNFDTTIATETEYKAELVLAAKYYVLACQSITWSGEEHTLAIITGTGSEDLQTALGV